MSKLDKNETSQAIAEALRAKRENRSSTATEIALLELSLMADIDSFDLDAAENQARHLNTSHSAGSLLFEAGLDFPEIAPAAGDFHKIEKRVVPPPAQAEPLASDTSDAGFLEHLRQQAARRQAEMQSAQDERSNINELIDAGMKKTFFFLNDMVQQLNILKPGIPRRYPLIESIELNNLVWQEGFADYRSQSQSAGALIELVSLSYQISTPATMIVERDGPIVERFRTLLFDYGLQFSCKEFRNERRYVERAEFDIASQLSVNARWQADYAHGRVILETRNLERLGGGLYPIRPEAIDQELLEAFGMLILNQPNHFRELSRR